VTDTSFFINLLPFLSAQPRRDRHVIVVCRQVVEQPPPTASQCRSRPGRDPRALGALVPAVRIYAVWLEDGDEQNTMTDHTALLLM
jgi:hypothetical protein